jgi:hypothetical protein
MAGLPVSLTVIYFALGNRVHRLCGNIILDQHSLLRTLWECFATGTPA